MLDAEPGILPDEKGTDAVKVVAGIDGRPKGLTLDTDAIAPELSLVDGKGMVVDSSVGEEATKVDDGPTTGDEEPMNPIG